ncbi:hypothetical protein MRB53_024447 [Persea americana]|uniref:Uncharacterized protein n=1 Tax=Persea americana TaxID=3435 RepID=A0ACC2LDM3_PERAE|nr:hypothetical protein MRB53_024447 [Persea americana]
MEPYHEDDGDDDEGDDEDDEAGAESHHEKGAFSLGAFLLLYGAAAGVPDLQRMKMRIRGLGFCGARRKERSHCSCVMLAEKDYMITLNAPAIAGGPVAAQIAVAAIAGRYHRPSPPVRCPATAADCRRERKKNQTILTQTITLRPSLHDRRRRCSVAVQSSPPRSPATCPPSPLKKKTETWVKALF